MAATAIGGGIKTFGDVQNLRDRASMFNFQSGVANVLSGALETRGNVIEAEGGRKAEQAGFVGAANIARSTVRGAAGNVSLTTGSTPAVVDSEIAIARENQGVARSDAAQAAYGERFQAAEETASAGVYGMAAKSTQQAILPTVGADVATTIGSVVGEATSPVAPKWSQQWTGASDVADPTKIGSFY